MKQVKLLAGTLGVAAVLVAQSAFGAGFGIYEGSARGNALGTEVTADPASPSVLYNNAAAMTALEGTQAEAGVTLIRPSQTVTTMSPQTGAVENDADSKWWAPPNAYVTHQFNDKVWSGVGVFSRYGLGVDYDSDWMGRYNCQKATIQSIDVNPSVAFKALDNLSLAAGLRAEWFEFELTKAIPTGTPFVDPDLSFNMKGDSWGIGYNLGAYYEATDWLSFGLAYDSEIEQEVEGTYETSHPLLSGGDGSGDVTTPGILRFGTSLKATDKLTVNAGIVYTMWSSYDELAIDFDPALLGERESSVTEKDWDDVFRYQLGVEYALTEAWALRAGYIYDETPDPDAHVDYIVPGNDRNLISLGVGYKSGDFFCDLSYTYLMIEDRDITVSAERAEEGVTPGEFSGGDAHLIGLSVGYKL
ncbi:MAG: OmpP1/FadL family transporter [Kiritimatiellia bacterium]